MRRPILFLACILLVLSAGIAHAAQPASKAEVARYAQALMERAYPEDGPGAAVLVARGDEVLYRGARGRASVELDVPLRAEHVFRLASVTKQFAAAAALKLAEDGKLSLDDPLTKFVPGYPGGDRVTVRMLLNHTSGIKSYTDLPGVMDGPIQKDVTTAQLIDTFKDETPEFAPGEGYRYNNSGYVLLGAVIEAASGQPWHEYLKTAFFEPLGMRHTGYGLESQVLIPNHVRGYSGAADDLRAARYLSMTQPHAAGALVSTVDDLLRWNRALHGGRLLNEAGYQRMITPEGKATEDNYGYGIVAAPLRGRLALQHGGGIFGYSTYLIYLPENELTVAVLQNTDHPTPGLGAGGVARRLAAFAVGEPYTEGAPIEVEAATLEAMQGVYRIDADTARVLRVVYGKLTSQRTGGPRFELVPIAPDAFLFENSLSLLIIERDAGGAITGMRFMQDGEGEGEVVPRTGEPLPDERPRLDLPREALDRVAGDYVRDSLTMRVFLEGTQLKAQLTGQPAIDVHAESPTTFYPTVVQATLVFSPEEGPAQALTLHQGGAEIEFLRKAD